MSYRSMPSRRFLQAALHSEQTTYWNSVSTWISAKSVEERPRVGKPDYAATGKGKLAALVCRETVRISLYIGAITTVYRTHQESNKQFANWFDKPICEA